MKSPSAHISKFFAKQLTKWHSENPREMPWKETSNPYYIWLSEIILQQTRVAQGTPYYLKFIKKYPSVTDLANATEDNVLSDWQGLGYYSRARNLHTAAKYITEELDGIFPNTYEGILALKGVGPYSAAAIGSFAFDLPYPVVDGNVKRVLSRFFDIADSIDEPAIHKLIEKLAGEIMAYSEAALFNQAIMNFGAIQCAIKSPECNHCPLSSKCLANKNNTVSERPVRSPKKKRKNRYFHYFVFVQNGEFILDKRLGHDIWQNMYAFPAIESTHALRLSNDIRMEKVGQYVHSQDVIKKYSPTVATQLLTHRKIKGTFYRYDLAPEAKYINDPSNLVSIKNLSNFALPKIIADYINEQLLGNRYF